MAVVGDVLEQPETGWTRYKRSEAVEIDRRITHNECLPIDWDSYISKSCMTIEPSRDNNFKKDTKIRLIGSTLTAESTVKILVGASGPPNTVASFVVPANISGTDVMLAEFALTEEMAAGYYIQIQFAGEMLYAIDVVNPTPTFEVMNIQPDSVDIGITLVERGQFRFTTVTEESGLVPIKEHFTYNQINYLIDIPYEGEVYTVENIDRYRTSLTSGNTGLIANTRYITYFYVDLEDKVYAVPFTTADLPNVTASLPSGTYTAPQTIELSCEVENSEIRYLAYNKGEEPAIETVDMSQAYNLYTEPFVVEDSDWNVCIFIQAFLNGDAISDIIKYEYDIKFVNLLEITTNKNILHFNILNFEEGKKYFLFLVQSNSLIKIYESSVKEFDISFKFDTEYSFCICDFYEGVTGDISNIVTVKTPIEKIIMPYGKTNDWKLNKNLIDEIYNFNFSSEKKKFQKFDYEYFLQSKKDNKYAAICDKRFADYFSFAIKMNLVILEQGNLCKIISNCSEDNFYGWAIMNVKDEIFLRYNGFKTKNIKIPQNKKIELIVEFNNNNYINFYLEKELILVTKKLGDIIYNSDCYIRIGDKISDSNSSFLINKIELFNGIFTNDFIANPNIISIKNKKNVNIIKFTEVPESSFYKVLRSENKFGKYKEIGIVEKTDE